MLAWLAKCTSEKKIKSETKKPFFEQTNKTDLGNVFAGFEKVPAINGFPLS
jgi:hypothetical protein